MSPDCARGMTALTPLDIEALATRAVDRLKGPIAKRALREEMAAVAVVAATRAVDAALAIVERRRQPLREILGSGVAAKRLKAFHLLLDEQHADLVALRRQVGAATIGPP